MCLGRNYDHHSHQAHDTHEETLPVEQDAILPGPHARDEDFEDDFGSFEDEELVGVAHDGTRLVSIGEVS